MAKSNSTICFCGVTFSRDEVFGPSVLKSIFGASLPSHFRVTQDGAVPVPVVIRHLRRQGKIGLQRMNDESDLIAPR